MKYKTKSLIEKNYKKNYLEQNSGPEITIESKIKNLSKAKMRYMES